MPFLKSNCVFATDSNGMFIAADHSFCKTTGYSINELISMGIVDIIHPDGRKKTLGKLSALRKKDRIACELKFQKKNGEIYNKKVNIFKTQDGLYWGMLF